MDPQKRMLLEVTYECLENAGMAIETLKGSKTGVYVGCMTNDYEILSTEDIYSQPHMANAGVSEAMIANRVSWFFDFRGPSLTIDTACSSSLYALHLACQSLKLGETDMNIVGGVNLILHPRVSSQLTAMNMLSPDGTCHSFDARANGYGRGEGVGALAVKRLSDAVRDGNVIRAVIRGSAVNVDGKTPSVTMPSMTAQAELINVAYETAGLSKQDTRYVEMHGTGTPLGDPIELSAIASTFGTAVTENISTAGNPPPVYVGSIKPSVGHTEGCAGLAGVFRAIISLEKGVILPTVGIETVNPKLKLDAWNLALPKEVMPWPADADASRRVSVNSFGFGGANAHVILDDAHHYMQKHGIDGFHSTDVRYCPPRDAGKGINESGLNGEYAAPSQPRLFILSARDKLGIGRMANAYLKYTQTVAGRSSNENLSAKAQRKMADEIAYTLAHKRSLFDYRSFVIADSVKQLMVKLGKDTPPVFRVPPKANGPIFVFTGQGAQWAGMGKELLALPEFAKSIARSSAYLSSLGCPFDLVAELLKTKEEGSSVDSPDYSQPMCTSVQVALTDVLRHWSIMPKAVVGHSSGEIAAAYACGIVTHEDAINVAYHRGLYSLRASNSSMRRGGMLAASLSEDEAWALLETRTTADNNPVVTVACVNSPNSVTLSGDENEIDALEVHISASGKFARKLRVSTAYHSAHMLQVADDCLQAMVQAGLGPPSKTSNTPMFSSVTGETIVSGEVDASYWIRNMCQTVHFSQAVQRLLRYSPSSKINKSRLGTATKGTHWRGSCVVELGPHPALKAPWTQIAEGLAADLAPELHYSSMLVRNEDAMSTAMHCAGRLWAYGNPLALSKVNDHPDGNNNVKLRPIVHLPTYPWNHDGQYWYESRRMRSERLAVSPRSDLLGARVLDQNPFEPQWKNMISARENPWIEDHVITGTTLYPGAGMLVMVIEAAQQIADSNRGRIRGVDFRHVHFERGLVCPQGEDIESLLSIKPFLYTSTPNPPPLWSQWFHFTVFSSLAQEQWTKHCFGSFRIVYEQEAETEVDREEQEGNDDPDVFDWRERVRGFQTAKKLPMTPINIAKFYTGLAAAGMEYGEMFQNLTSLYQTKDEVMYFGTVKVPDTQSVQPGNFEYPHKIHPATLDSIFHLAVAAVLWGPGQEEAAVPIRLNHMYIANNLPQGVGSLFHGYATRNLVPGSLLSTDLVASDETWAEPKIIVEGLVMKKVTMKKSADDFADESTSMSQAPYEEGANKRCTRAEWKLDPSLLAAPRNSTAGSYHGVTKLRDWFKVECHKSPGQVVLLVGWTLRPAVLDELFAFSKTQTSAQAFSRLVVIDSVQKGSDIWLSELARVRNHVIGTFQAWDTPRPGETPTIGGGNDEFDLIVAGGNQLDNLMLLSLETLLKPAGRVLTLEQTTVTAPRYANGSQALAAGYPPPGYTSTPIALEEGLLTVTKRKQSSSLNKQSKVYLLLPESEADVISDPKVECFVSHLAALLIEVGLMIQRTSVTNVVALEKGEAQRNVYFIALLELDGGFADTWTPVDFAAFKLLIHQANHIFWISRGGQMLVPCSDKGLSGAATTGLFRVLRNEYPHLSLVHLDLSVQCDLMGLSTAELVMRAWLGAVASGDYEYREHELAEYQDEILIPRYLRDAAFDQEIGAAMGTATPVRTHLWGSGPLCLEMSHGAVNPQRGGQNLARSLWKPDDECHRGAAGSATIDPDQVEIRTHHASTAVQGKATDALRMLGTQIVGVVTCVGAHVTGVASGDSVVAFNFCTAGSGSGTYGGATLRTHIRQHRGLVRKIPNEVPHVGAATTVWLHMVASYIIDEVMRVQRGDVVLVEDGMASMSRALLAVARRRDILLFTTAARREDRMELVERYGLEPSAVLHHKVGMSMTSNSSYIFSRTQGKPVNVLITKSAAAEGLMSHGETPSWLADFARVSALVTNQTEEDSGGRPSVVMSNFSHRDITVSTINPDRMLRDNPRLVTQMLARLDDELLASAGTSGHMEKYEATALPVSDLAAAYDFLDTGNSKRGIVALVLEQQSEVYVTVSAPPLLQLDSQGTYILAGGLGSLGLRIGKLMARHGARHVVLLSRSGTRSKYQADLDDIASNGCQVEVIRCDVTKASDVTVAIRQLMGARRRIKGLVQCAMVLHDAVFGNMTFEQWHGAYDPKVKGTWHLHQALLPSDEYPGQSNLDFFILLSSVVSIIGNVAQANYAAANAWMDALAHHRRALGYPAVSLNVGIVLDSDHNIDGVDIANGYLERFGHMSPVSTTLDELEIGLMACMRGSTVGGAGHIANDTEIPPQVVFGMSDKLPATMDQWWSDVKFCHRRVRKTASDGGDATMTGDEQRRVFVEALRVAPSLEEATSIILESVKQLLAPGLGLQPMDIKDEEPLFMAGVDSFKAIEVRNHVFHELKSDISVFDILSPASLAHLAATIAARSQLLDMSRLDIGGDVDG
ncbi:Type I Iterative PKS [Pestalotiopsis sp. IQ-011]